MIKSNKISKAYYKLPVIILAFLLLYYPIVYYMAINWWEDPNYAHGFVVPLISGYMVWKRRDLLAGDFSPSIMGLPLLLTGTGILFLGYAGSELFLMRFSILVVISGLVLFLLGKRHLLLLAFPIGFLVFMIPLPQIAFNAIAFPLQMFAARIATEVIQWLGIPVLRDGNIIQLANMTLEVAEACSGIRSLVTILTVSTAYVYFSEGGAFRKLAFISAAVPITIMVNSARVTVTAVLAQYFGNFALEGFYHAFEGWLMFVVALALLFSVDIVLKRFLK